MQQKEKIDELKYCIGRFDGYYDSVNNKGNVFLALNTFILGGLIAAYTIIVEKCAANVTAQILLTLTLFANIGSLVTTLLAIKPYLNSKSDTAKGSLLFFGDVADYHYDSHVSLWENLQETDYYKDLRTQHLLLARGLKNKFRFLYTATWLIAVQTILVFAFMAIVFLTK